VLLLGPFPRIAGMAVAAATGLKLWPALLLPALAARHRERRRLVGVVAAIGAVLFLGSVVLAGWARLVSPLAWQADRGLQIESVLATPVMLAWAVEPGPHVVGYSEFNAFEITGPGVAALLVAGTVSTVLIAIGLILLWVRAWHRADTLTHDGVVWLGLAAVTAFMVSSRVLSPQYLLWLLPLAAAGLAVVRTARGLRRLRRWVTVLLVSTLATQLVFPVFYGNLTVHTEDSYGVVLLVAARNVALVWLLVEAAREAWWQLRTAPGQGQRGIELERQPPGPEGNDARTLR
jgi:Glycosyltransferase family 87